MFRNARRIRMTAVGLALILLLGLIPMGYTEEANVTEELPDAAEEVTAAEPEPDQAPEAETVPAPELETVSGPAPAEEHQVVTEVPREGEIRIEETPAEPEGPEDDDGEWEGDDVFGDGLVEFDDDDAGVVSEVLLQQFNNPDSFQQVEFTGCADIELDQAERMFSEGWDGRVTLTARVSGASLSYRLVWEANDHDERGWFTVGSGDRYSYIMTRENARREAEREYRVVMFAID